jgi:hypothetical protein
VAATFWSVRRGIFVDGLVEVRDAGMAAITGADANYPRVGR